MEARFASRLIAARGDIADRALVGTVTAERFVDPDLMAVSVPVVDLFSKPDSTALASQLLMGAPFAVLEQNIETGMAFGQAVEDGYVGYVAISGLGPATDAVVRVTARATHVYPEPNMKTLPSQSLPFAAKIAARPVENGFRETPLGYIPAQHLDQPLGDDFVAIAERLIGAPYLWGGSSSFGLDCSALIQTALQAIGQSAPRDSDMQEAMLGEELAQGMPLMRGDLVFWKGHIGVMRDGETLLHANAGAMAVALEDLEIAEARIAAAGDGPITSRKRLKT